MARSQEVSSVQVAAPPAGFQRTGSANAIGWWSQSTAGNILSGTLLGMFSRKDQMRQEGTSKFFQVQVDTACAARADRGENAKMVDVKPGDIVNVNFGPKTSPWQDFVADIKRGAVYRVWVLASGRKLPINGGRTMHDLDARHMLVTPPVDVPELGDAGGETDEAVE